MQVTHRLLELSSGQHLKILCAVECSLIYNMLARNQPFGLFLFLKIYFDRRCDEKFASV